MLGPPPARARAAGPPRHHDGSPDLRPRTGSSRLRQGDRRRPRPRNGTDARRTLDGRPGHAVGGCPSAGRQARLPGIVSAVTRQERHGSTGDRSHRWPHPAANHAMDRPRGRRLDGRAEHRHGALLSRCATLGRPLGDPAPSAAVVPRDERDHAIDCLAGRREPVDRLPRRPCAQSRLGSGVVPRAARGGCDRDRREPLAVPGATGRIGTGAATRWPDAGGAVSSTRVGPARFVASLGRPGARRP